MEELKAAAQGIIAPSEPAPHPGDGPSAAGVALHAADTGRVLFIQRALIDGEPAGGLWEFPGGNMDGGESPWDAAQREFGEETGEPLPDGQTAGTWMSPNGVYQGFIHVVPSEDCFNGADGADPSAPTAADQMVAATLPGRHVENPDAPGQKNHTESMAWMDPAHMDRGPRLLRHEMRTGTPWSMIKQPPAVMNERNATVASVRPITIPVTFTFNTASDVLTSGSNALTAAAADGGHDGMVKLSTGWAYPIKTVAQLNDAKSAFGRSKPADREKLRRHIVAKAKELGVFDQLDDKWKEGSMTASIDEIDSLVASLAQPAAALLREDPLDGPTPYVVNDDGTADGHLALWASCHIGYPGCVKPPQEDSFDFYNLGDAVTADGRHVPVGKVTVGCGHAGPDLTWRTASAHYDHSGSSVAVAHAIADKWGIRLPSVLVADASGAQIDELRRSPLSGDWRRINGKLRLVAALGVNVPGYPVARALVAAGEVQSMFVGFDAADAAALVLEADSLAASIGLDPAGRAAALRSGLGLVG